MSDSESGELQKAPEPKKTSQLVRKRKMDELAALKKNGKRTVAVNATKKSAVPPPVFKRSRTVSDMSRKAMQLAATTEATQETADVIDVISGTEEGGGIGGGGADGGGGSGIARVQQSRVQNRIEQANIMAQHQDALNQSKDANKRLNVLHKMRDLTRVVTPVTKGRQSATELVDELTSMAEAEMSAAASASSSLAAAAAAAAAAPPPSKKKKNMASPSFPSYSTGAAAAAAAAAVSTKKAKKSAAAISGDGANEKDGTIEFKPGMYEQLIKNRNVYNETLPERRTPAFYRGLRQMYEMQSRAYMGNRIRLNQSRNRQSRLADRMMLLVEQMHETGADCMVVYMNNSQRSRMVAAATPRMRWMLDDPATAEARQRVFNNPRARNITYIETTNPAPYAGTFESLAPTPFSKKQAAAAAAASIGSNPVASSSSSSSSSSSAAMPSFSAASAATMESDSENERILDADELNL